MKKRRLPGLTTLLRSNTGDRVLLLTSRCDRLRLESCLDVSVLHNDLVLAEFAIKFYNVFLFHFVYFLVYSRWCSKV